MVYTLTMHLGRCDSKGRPFQSGHNDRSSGRSLPHVDRSLTHNNINIARGSLSFSEAEKAMYGRLFSKYIDDRNERARRSRHPERRTSVEKLLSEHPPEECIFAIGNRDNNPGPYVLMDVFVDFQKKVQQSFPGYKIIDAALHVDEPAAGPHIHFRAVYFDKQAALPAPSEAACLKRNGFTGSKSSRENPKVEFTKVLRSMLAECCRSHGVDISEKIDKSKNGRSLSQLKEDTERGDAVRAQELSDAYDLAER